MNRGLIEQVGSTDEVYSAPRTPFVFDFLGGANVLPGEVRDGGVYIRGAHATVPSAPVTLDGPVEVFVRPADFRVVGPDVPSLAGVILQSHRRGSITRLDVELRELATRIDVEVPAGPGPRPAWQPGSAVHVWPTHCGVYPRGAHAREQGWTPEQVLRGPTGFASAGGRLGGS
jgi:sulfate transport system ATP-binding protein